MTLPNKPVTRPANPLFSSGPTTKHPGWSLDNLKNAALGRSHRSKTAVAKLKEAIDRSREVLQVPDDYLIGIMPGSDTGAVEAAMWSLLGGRPVQVFAWENFGLDWVIDIFSQLKIEAEQHTADYGQLPDLSKARKDADIVFTWNGTTSGVKVPNGDWISADREGVTICDATSAAYAMPLDWAKLDVVTYSWQKIMGGEAAHGMIILSPHAVKRLESYNPPWPIPKLFRLTKDGKLIKGIFDGSTINTPSLLCTEDFIDTLKWAESIGGLEALHARSNESLAILTDWEAKSGWAKFLCEDAGLRSNTGITFIYKDERVASLSKDDQYAFSKKLTGLLEEEGVAFDANGYRTAPPGLRIWCGATVEPSNVKALLPWLDWAFEVAVAEL